MAILEEPIKGVKNVKNYINGEWVDSKGEYVDVVNPANMKVIGKCPISTKNEFDSAVQAAKEAYPDWRRTTPLARTRMLFRLKQLMEENFEEISRIQTQEHGKCIDESRGETRRGIENVEVACGIPTLQQGYFSEDIAHGIDEFVIPTPLGVFGIIGPFNFPWMIPLWSAPYAIATGNTVVVKPSSEVPLSQMKLAELTEEAGIPPGVWNVVNGGRTVVSAMLDNKDIAGVTFVGSTPVGRDVIYKRCGETGKRVIAQCGAKNFMTIMPDCDVDRTVAAMMTSFFGNTGQRCLAAANAVLCGVDDKFYNSFMEKVVAQVKNIRVGYGLDESIQMGPLRDKSKKENVLRYIESGIKDGFKLTVDGRIPKINGDYPDTCYLGPTIFEDVDPKSKIGSEEIFGPVMSVMRVKDLNEAIQISNENNFANGHSIFTTNGKAAREFQYNILSGNVGINVGITAAIAYFPFGGSKDSFFGTLHTQGKEAVRFFTESKVVIQRWF
ncbi:MAG: CoA-acylating methylmalonate-semialdehyde dehydrogenase [Dehalococcoidales bacterium]|nr:CoA-acylating methylmalonate-semialdehyde dehydrogenase [Dehalococcoidales bacterium]